MTPKFTQPKTPGTQPMPVIVKKPVDDDNGPITMGNKGILKKAATNLDKRDFQAMIYNGIECLITDPGGAKDKILLANGFDHINESIVVQVKNPAGFLRLANLLATKFYIPPAVKANLDAFAIAYAKHKTAFPFKKAQLRIFHTAWVKQERMKASKKGEIRPYGVVENGKVYIYADCHTCPAARNIPKLSMPIGCQKVPQTLAATLIKMTPNIAAVKATVQTLMKEGVVVANQKQFDASVQAVHG
jgi:hypothetical protein